MFSIHHIHTIRAVPSRFDDANYLTLEFITTTEGEESTSLVLYFTGPLEPGTLKAFAAAINYGAGALDREPKPEPATQPVEDDIPF